MGMGMAMIKNIEPTFSRDFIMFQAPRSHLFRILGCFLLILFLNGCESIQYYGQAAHGQLEILIKREPIKELVEQEDIDDQIKQQLQLVLDVREFAQNHLSLEVGKQYSTYVDLERPYVVWNVFAAPEFSTNAYEWCYPVIGCAAYRGYFSEEAALKYEEKMKEQGFDTYVGGIAAYSTLGWFNDSILNTFIKRKPNSLASLIFHELAHQRIYAKGDSTFNESFATVVEQHGLEQWLEHQGEEPSKDSSPAKMQNYRKDFIQLVLDTREELQMLYDSQLDEQQMRKKKNEAIQTLRAKYKQIKDDQWQGFSGYDHWFNSPINNAKLSTIATYHDLVPELNALLASVNHDLNLFYQECDKLSEMSKDERHKSLKQYLP